MFPKNSYHFSIDDVFDALIEVSDKKISLFKHPFFGLLKEIHNEFDVKVGLHLFYKKNVKGKMRTLKEIINIRKEIKKNPWLFFGPHALDYEIPPYAQVIGEQIKTFDKIYKEIDRFAGKKSYTRNVRLHYYSESIELAGYFRKRGVIALFTTDRDIGSHSMPKAVGKELLEKGFTRYNGMNFIKTQFRVEFFAVEGISVKEVLSRMQNAFNKYGFVIFYTHEADMLNQGIKRMIKLMFDATRKLGLISVKKP